MVGLRLKCLPIHRRISRSDYQKLSSGRGIMAANGYELCGGSDTQSL